MGVKIQRIAACFEGTWNTDKSNTNVSRLFRRIANEGTGCPEQSRFYDEGVGTRLGERIRSGMLGIGLDANIRQGYAWLASHYNRLADLHAGASSRSTVPARPQEFALTADAFCCSASSSSRRAIHSKG